MYSDLICDHFTDPTYAGNIDAVELEFIVGNSVCGDRIEVQAKTQDGVVSDIAYRAWGCATSVATGDIFCCAIKGVAIDEIEARDNDCYIQMLGELEPSQKHCIKIMEELHLQFLAALNSQGYRDE
ncbi:MAG: nitrogen fixation NifU-like protein [Moritella dasanensis]|jgi:nitrogen fixation NifU-like protein